MRRTGLLATVAALAAALPAMPASAHPLDEVVQQIYLTPATSTLDIEITITAGALAAPGFARSLDTDGDRRLSAAETKAHDVRVMAALTMTADETPADLTVTGSEYPDLPLLEAGGGVITLRASAPLDAAAKRFAVTGNYQAAPKTRVQMSVIAARDAGRVATGVERGADGRAIAASLTPGDAGPGAAAAAGPLRGTGDAMLRALREPLGSPWALALLIAVCALLGALHALTPGHGKAMLAGYLVGSRGTARHAFALGGVITATHTGSVLLLGGAVLVAGHYVVPGLLVPALKILTGVVVLVLGIRITLRRWRGLRSGVPDRDRRFGHSHQSFHDDFHDSHDGLHDDSHDDSHEDFRDDFREGEVFVVDPGSARGHRGSPDHAWPYDRGVVLTAEREVIPQSAASRRRELAAMGAAGGLIPCPEALGVLILAVGLHRTGLGIAMIVAFSVGLAAVLVGFGLILISARDRFAGMRPGPLLARLPMVSAVLVLVLGVMMTVSGLLEAVGT